MAGAALTRALVRALPPPPDGVRKYRVHDTAITGFCVEVRCTGERTYYLRYSDARGRRRAERIGRHGDITLDQARRCAAELRAQIALGCDPAGERDRLRAVPTLAGLAAERSVPHARDTTRSAAD